MIHIFVFNIEQRERYSNCSHEQELFVSDNKKFNILFNA
jgi:hypothetical protein